MRMRTILFSVLTLFSCLVSCAEGKNSGTTPQNNQIDFNDIFRISKKSEVVIQNDVDLGGRICKVPKGIKLRFAGGVVKNGTLVGAKTKILYSDKAFDKVTIKGTWRVDTIRSTIFKDLRGENSLKNVFALCSPDVKNTLIITKGDHSVSVKKNGEICLLLCANTELVLDGTIRLIPNNFRRCDIIRATGSNITISGNGRIIGDKDEHLGTDGQWGMGIRFHDAHQSIVKDLNISNCWGDCIYVGGNSTDIVIQNCKLDNSRRQGISVTKADDVTIKDCVITNVGGSNPQYAIDIEPNAGDTVDHIKIENVIVRDCEGGLLVTKGKKNLDKKTIGTVDIRNCTVSAKSKYPIRLNKAVNASIENCIVYSTNGKTAITSTDIDNLVVCNNTIYVNKQFISSLKNGIKKIVGKDVPQPFGQIRVKKQRMENNRIIEQ